MAAFHYTTCLIFVLIITCTIVFIQRAAEKKVATCPGGVQVTSNYSNESVEEAYCVDIRNTSLDTITGNKGFWAILCVLTEEGTYESLTLFTEQGPILKFEGALLHSFKQWLRAFIASSRREGCRIFGNDLLQMCHSPDGWRLGSMQIIQPSVEVPLIPLNNFIYTLFEWT